MIKFVCIFFLTTGCFSQHNGYLDGRNYNTIRWNSENRRWDSYQNRRNYLSNDMGWYVNKNEKYNPYIYAYGTSYYGTNFPYVINSDPAKREGFIDSKKQEVIKVRNDKDLSNEKKEDFEDNKARRYEIDAGNPDIYGKIERPCELYDLFCIRRFFAEHSTCKVVKGPVPEPLFRPQTTFNIPRANISAILTNVEYKGLNNVRIEEFYINKATDNLVISLGFESISFFSNDTYIRYYMNRREPVTTRDFAGANFQKLSITVIIPKINYLQLERAETFTFSNVFFPPFIAGPGLAGLGQDPTVQIMFLSTILNIPIDLQETLLTEGVFYAATYIQNNICDFGLKVL